MSSKQIEHLIVDTTAFIQNAPLQEIGVNIITLPEVVQEITNKRQLRRLAVLPYDLVVKEVFPENIKIVTDFAKKTGDFPSLSATDLKVIALTYQLEKERVGVSHINVEPTNRLINVSSASEETHVNLPGFYNPKHDNHDNKTTESEITSTESVSSNDDDIIEMTESLKNFNSEVFEHSSNDDLLVAVEENHKDEVNDDDDDYEEDDEEDWITPTNIHEAKIKSSGLSAEEKHVKVACMTTDFAMQNVLKQMNLNISALDGRIIKQLRSYILRCYACFRTTSIMTKKFCPKCGNDTLKKVSVVLDEEGPHIYINPKHPLTARGKKYSLPTFKGGKHSNNPILTEDQPQPDQRPSRIARTKTNAFEDDYIVGFSPFAIRDVTSKSAQLHIKPGNEVKHWMRRNPNEARRKRK